MAASALLFRGTQRHPRTAQLRGAGFPPAYRDQQLQIQRWLLDLFNAHFIRKMKALQSWPYRFAWQQSWW